MTIQSSRCSARLIRHRRLQFETLENRRVLAMTAELVKDINDTSVAASLSFEPGAFLFNVTNRLLQQ